MLLSSQGNTAQNIIKTATFILKESMFAAHSNPASVREITDDSNPGAGGAAQTPHKFSASAPPPPPRKNKKPLLMLRKN